MHPYACSIMDWLGLAALAAIMLWLLSLSGCAHTTERPECSDRALLELESRYVAEVLVVCDGQHFDTCRGREALDAKYDALRKEWVQCK